MITNIFNAGESNPASVRLNLIEVSATVIRPSDTTTYSTKDVVSDSTSAPTILTFSNMARANNGGGNITKASVQANSATGMLGTAFRLYLYSVAPTPINDNAQFPLLWANRSNKVGYIDFSALAIEGTGGDSCYAIATDFSLPFKCASDDNSLYGIPMVSSAGAAPITSEIFLFKLFAEQY